MSRLEELIRELCPDGVEYKTLGEIALDIYRGSGIKRDQVTETGIPCVRYGEIYTTYGIWFDECVSHTDLSKISGPKFFEHGDILFAITGESIEDIAKSCAYVGHEKCLAGGDIVILKHKQNPKYLSYALATSAARKQKSSGKVKSKVVHSSVPAIKEIVIPVPPLPVQAEIVRILDNFTERTTELAEQLTAELTARKKQYEYYRDKLLTFGVRGGGASDAVWRTLRSIVKSSCSGGTPAKGNSDYYEGGTIPWIRTQDVQFNEIYKVDTFITETAVRETSVKWIPENCVIVAISGASAGRCAINKIRATTNQHCLNMEVDSSQALYRYVYHCVCSKYQELLTKKQGARGDLNSTLILETEIPVPPLPVQQRIVNVLDNFDAICTDLNIGLPAEIEARQKQYEYYRDLLLSFDDCSQLVHVEREREREAERRDVIKLLQYVFGYVMLPLKDVSDAIRGEYITKKSTKAGNIPVILGGQEPAYYIDKSNHTGEIVVIARSGVSAGFVSYWNEPIFITDGFGYEAKGGLTIPKFLFYVLKNRETELNAMKRGAGVPHVSGEALGQVMLAVPTLKEQARIVSILDRFDVLCNDLTSGLPAEIEARQRQYEYYRDKLLTFKELNP